MTDQRTNDDPTLGALVHQLTQQVPDLIRSEMRLAQAEVAEKGKRAGVGIGMFSVAGLLAFFAIGTLIATAVLALALVVDAWRSCSSPRPPSPGWSARTRSPRQALPSRSAPWRASRRTSRP
jgi:uncharacterized membrane protein YqjE